MTTVNEMENFSQRFSYVFSLKIKLKKKRFLENCKTFDKENLSQIFGIQLESLRHILFEEKKMVWL